MTASTPSVEDAELIDTVAVHVRWLRRDGLTGDHRLDNEQSADYLDRLVELLVLVTGRLGPQPEITRQQIADAIDGITFLPPVKRQVVTDAVWALLDDGTAPATPEAER